MKIKKIGNQFVAYRDKNDVNTEDGIGMSSQINIGDSLGQISIKTSRFVGNTFCASALRQHLNEYKEANEDSKQQFINKCIEEIKKDVAVGDVTAIDELLGFVPEKYLRGYLPE